MNIRYSTATGSFYPIDIDYGDSLPPDVQTVDYDLYTQAMSRPDGSTFDIIDGVLVITAAPPPDYAPQALSYMATVRTTRELVLNRITGISVGTTDTDLQAACRVARQNLLDLPAAPGIAAATNLDDLKMAVLTAYRAIVVSVPNQIKTAFAEVDA